MDQKLASVLVPEKISWATATRSIRKCKTRIEKIGGSHVDTEPTAWGLDVQVWNLLWTGEEAMKKGIRDVQQIAEAQIGEGVADMVKFKAQVIGHEATEKANRIQAWQGLSDLKTRAKNGGNGFL